MVNFFDTIINFFETIWDVVINLINSLVTLLQVAATSITLPAWLIGLQLPSFLIASVSAVTAIAIAKLKVGRGLNVWMYCFNV